MVKLTEVVWSMVRESIPKEGENIKIQSYKHDGTIAFGLKQQY